ncbi:MAG: AI-2E family transporter [Butyrivibrio sp.]|nr:AI-2E family transporter [Butyrivibrio sp.]
MDNFIKKLDQKYLKICLYSSITVLITIGLAAVLLSTGPFWTKLWAIFTAVLRPIIIGGVLCYLFMPIVNKFENIFNRKKTHKWARALSVILTFAIVLSAIIIILVLIAIALYKNVESLNVDSIKNVFAALKNDYTDVWTFVEGKLESYNVSTDGLSTVVSSTTSAVSNFFSGLLFGVIFSVYFMLDGNNISNYWGKAFLIIFGQKSEDKLIDFMKDVDRAFSGYIRGQFTDALIVGILVAFSLSLAGVPYAVLVGVFAGLGNLIPYLGPVIGYATLVIVCLPTAAFDKMLIGIVIFAIVMFVDGNIINPKLLANNVEVHPLLVVAALIGGGALGGIAGMLIAVPTAALLKLQFDRYLERLKEKRKMQNE